MSKRLQLTFNAEGAMRMDRLRDVTEASSYIEVIKNALKLYEFAIEEGGQSARLVVQRPDGTTAMVNLFTPKGR